MEQSCSIHHKHGNGTWHLMSICFKSGVTYTTGSMSRNTQPKQSIKVWSNNDIAWKKTAEQTNIPNSNLPIHPLDLDGLTSSPFDTTAWKELAEFGQQDTRWYDGQR